MAGYICPACGGPLDRAESALICRRCGRSYPIENDIVDFSGGAYYDSFTGEDQLTPEHRVGLVAEVTGSRWRIERYYAPKLARRARVLDCGCGNGVSVDVLHELGFDAWGVDLSALRKWQWRERTHRDRLAVANALQLPFNDGFFDVVITSGVIEHIGVRETGGASYAVEPLPDRDALREQFVAELLRVTRAAGRVFVDAPNGTFPIDFWHGGAGGQARWHRRDERFLPKFSELRALAREHDVTAVSPAGRFAFRQVGRHWYGRLFAAPVALLFALMRMAPALARSAVNPYLVIEIRKKASRG
ncbi:MAG TPA: methyltransferase domain-containing protein [Thermoanaerobaculia bacterium]